MSARAPGAPTGGTAAERRREAVVAGHQGDAATARALLRDPAPAVRASALQALARAAELDDADLAAGLADTEPGVRSKAVELAIPRQGVALLPLLEDGDPSVVEQAAWACGERGSGGPAVAGALARVARHHAETPCREAAVAALGALGDLAGRAAVLEATRDRPTVRRRAVIALAAFDGPEVEDALQRALKDRDWQVRQAAEDQLER